MLYAAYGVEMRPAFFVFSCKKKVNAVALALRAAMNLWYAPALNSRCF